jgi:cytochrome P450
MYPRQTTREVELGGVLLPAGARLGVVIGSANRDEEQFDNAAEFDINRRRRPHLAFGGGTHYCIGAWIARAQASVALPLLVQQLPGLGLDGGHRPTVTGWVFRGVRDLHASWTPAGFHDQRNRDEEGHGVTQDLTS